jgi:serine phosphatase RsbU (regulator of sigma subunit)
MKQDIPLRVSIMIAGSILLLVLMVHFSPLSPMVNKNITLPVNFYFRSLLDRNPPVSPLLKIYAFDDATLQFLDKPDLSLKEWAELLRAIADAKPGAIYIDKLFGTPELEGREVFNEIVGRITVPIISGGFIQPVLTRKASLVDLSRPEFASPRYDEPRSGEMPLFLQSLPQKGGFFYGSHQSIQNAIKRVGHIMYEGDGTIKPFVKLNSATVIPHLSFTAIEGLSFKEGYPTLRGKRIDMDENGSLNVNFLPMEVFSKHFISLKSALTRSREGASFSSVVNEGQIVLILPAMYTGNSDWVETPVGYIPGGYLIAGMLNSVLTGEWLTSSSYDLLLCMIVMLISITLAHRQTPIWWLITSLGGSLFIAALGISLFALKGWIIDWPLLLFTFLATSIWLFGLRWQYRERQFREDQIKRASMQQAAIAVQKALIHNNSQLKDITFVAAYRAADTLGGDWYGIYQYEAQGKVFLFIGDVTGHGFSSALVTGAVAGSINTTLSFLIEQDTPVALCLEKLAVRVNEVILETGFHAQRCMTMAMIGLDLKSRAGYLLNCGHVPIYVKNGGLIQKIMEGGDLLGLDAPIKYKMRSWTIARQDMIFAYTDGLLENSGPCGETVTKRALMEHIRNAVTPGELVANIQKYIDEKWQNEPIVDDCSFFALSCD